MDLVKINPPYTFHDNRWPVYTRPRYLLGTRLHDCTFEHSLLADGCLLKNSTVKNSVIGIRAVVQGAELENVLLMGVDSKYKDMGAGAPPVGIGEGSVIRRAILDKNARIGRNVRITNEMGVTELDGDGWCIRDGIVVVAKNTVIPDGTVI